ncbi:MAG: hypothetical protein ACUVR3_03645, partial [Candidatus Roseilinea sp.]|uniref:hypothetical protein n=1 Tax=Candidatus Roseilinea sp. TaxID=2838777 RepID=UPI004049F487
PLLASSDGLLWLLIRPNFGKLASIRCRQRNSLVFSVGFLRRDWRRGLHESVMLNHLKAM